MKIACFNTHNHMTVCGINSRRFVAGLDVTPYTLSYIAGPEGVKMEREGYPTQIIPMSLIAVLTLAEEEVSEPKPKKPTKFQKLKAERANGTV